MPPIVPHPRDEVNHMLPGILRDRDDGRNRARGFNANKREAGRSMSAIKQQRIA